MKIYLAADHAGFELKEIVKKALIEKCYDVIDCGAEKLVPGDDYPKYMAKAAELVARNPESKAILFGASGEGEAMVANREKGVRAAEYYGGNLDIIRLSREHNDANALSIGARFVKPEEALAAIKLWLETPFSHDPRHERRIEKF
jgi:ribose 5-phosphate isomerase B